MTEPVDISPQRGRRDSLFPRMSIGLALAVLACAVVLGSLFELDFGDLTRDPAALAGMPPYTGAISNFGVLFWAGAAFVPAFAATGVRNCGGSFESWGILAALSGLSAILCADDLFMVHEHVPIPENILYAVYALALVSILVRWRKRAFSGHLAYLGLAGLFFFASIAVDLRQSQVESWVGIYRILLEDGFKLLGIVFWLNYVWSVSLALYPSARGVRSAA